jgi:prolyl-tRNA editing enzyme YbaK/EbsC (Cys-tRNA(Pro) deacylase)
MYSVLHRPRCIPLNRLERERVSKTNGGVPPFGHTTQLRVFVDPDLLQYDEVWAAAGTWNDNFGANPNDIVRVASGVITDLKR